METFTCAHGNVGYYVEKLPGCCGVAVVHNVTFDRKPYRDLQDFYDEFHNHLKTVKTPFNINRCKIIMTDRIRGMDDPSIYSFCHRTEWEVGSETFNKKSGHRVQVFEMSRKVIGAGLYDD